MLMLLAVIAVVLFVLYIGSARKAKLTAVAHQQALSRIAALEQQFAPVLDAEKEAQRILKAAEVDANAKEASARSTVEQLLAESMAIANQIEELRASYGSKKEVYDRLAQEVAIFDEKLAFAELGLYAPHFDFDTSDAFKDAINQVRDRQKSMIKAKTAVIADVEWVVDGSKAKGRTMTGRNIRLALRAFNNECDAAIANVRWNNANAMEKRVANARRQIDKLNESNKVYISEEYFQLKLSELHLTHEYREKLKDERDHRAELARAAREEQRLQRDLEAAEREEARYEKMLEKARAEAATAVGERLDRYMTQIAELESDLNEAHARVERGQAMAELTRSGYVYIVSNVGSFGPDMVKIGLTRRLDPSDRVRELSGASVPFVFDTHAIIYSEDAPGLERALHNEFAEHRVNAANFRKEFFNVSIEDVEQAVTRLAPEATFFSDIEAQEYHETLAIRAAQVAAETEQAMTAFPDSI